MRRIIQLFDSTDKMWVNLALYNEYAGQNGNWNVLPGNEKILNFNSGRFESRLWGVDILAQDRNGGPCLVARLLGFCYVTGIYCNDKGNGQIMQGNYLENDNNARWKWYS